MKEITHENFYEFCPICGHKWRWDRKVDRVKGYISKTELNLLCLEENLCDKSIFKDLEDLANTLNNLSSHGWECHCLRCNIYCMYKPINGEDNDVENWKMFTKEGLISPKRSVHTLILEYHRTRTLRYLKDLKRRLKIFSPLPNFPI